jgi:phospholipid-binding lipoprotein MlaA
MSVDPLRKALYFATVTVLFIIISGDVQAGETNHEPAELPGLILSQQTQKSIDKQSEISSGEVLEKDEAETENEAEDEYDDEYDDEDEYADEEEVELIPDPFSDLNRGLLTFNDRLYFWLLKPVC